MIRRGQNMADYIAKDREGFRADATEALRAFTPEDREIAASLQAKKTVADDIVRAWHEQIEPIYSELETVRDSGKLEKQLMTQVGFSEQQAARMTSIIIDERKNDLLEEVLDNIYASVDDDEPYQRAYAAKLLSRPEIEVDTYMNRYIDFVEALDNAEKYDVALCDPHASWLERQRMALIINKERSETSKQEDLRLDAIDQELAAIAQNHDSLLGRVIDHGWDFSTVLRLRDKFQKQLAKLDTAKQKDATEKLTLFERTTKSFRETEATRQAGTTPSLAKLRHASSEIYDTLLEFLTLAQTQFTKLVKDIETYTRLTRERDMILLIQRNREHFLNLQSHR